MFLRLKIWTVSLKNAPETWISNPLNKVLILLMEVSPSVLWKFYEWIIHDFCYRHISFKFSLNFQFKFRFELHKNKLREWIWGPALNYKRINVNFGSLNNKWKFNWWRVDVLLVEFYSKFKTSEILSKFEQNFKAWACRTHELLWNLFEFAMPPKLHPLAQISFTKISFSIQKLIPKPPPNIQQS